MNSETKRKLSVTLNLLTYSIETAYGVSADGRRMAIWVILMPRNTAMLSLWKHRGTLCNLFPGVGRSSPPPRSAASMLAWELSCPEVLGHPKASPAAAWRSLRTSLRRAGCYRFPASAFVATSAECHFRDSAIADRGIGHGTCSHAAGVAVGHNADE